MAKRLADVLWIWRWWLTAGIVAGGVVLAPRADFTKIDNDITAWFSKADPIYREYDRFREEFGGTRTLIIALDVAADAPDAAAGVFTAERLRLIDELSDAIERVRTVEHVNSLGTATLVTATPPGKDDDGGLEVEPLIPDEVRLKPDQIRARALGDDLIRGDLVSEDGRTAAIMVSFDEDRIDDVRGAVLDEIRAVVEPRLPPGVRAHFNGSIEISETYNRVTADNQRTFIPPIFVLTFGAIYLMFRSVRRTVLAIVAVSLSIVWTLGLYSLAGFTYNVLSSMIVPLIVVLAIADDVHIMQHFEHERRNADPEQAFKRTVRHLLAPLLGASGTTALGMLSLATSNVVAVRQFGIGSAVGIMVDFAISIAFMPTLLAWMKPEAAVAPHEAWLVRPMRGIARFSSGRPRQVLAIASAVLLAAIAGVPRLRVDTNHINFFAEDHPLGSSARVIDRKLAGVYSFQFLLEGPPDSMKTPDALRRMERLAEEISRLPFVKKVTSPADYVKRINRELHGGTPSAAIVPADANLIAQELFLFAMSDDGRTELERMISPDFSKAQVSVKFASMSSDLLYEEIERSEAIAAEVFAGTGIRATATGAGKLFSTLDHYLVVSQLSSFGTAFLTVFGVIFLVFRSARFGLLAIVPNLFPVVAVLGVMGWLGISLNIATIMVASVALGIVDDDTIHFINRFRRETARGAGVDEAIETATVFEGRASLTTAFINSCAYATVMMSAYKPTAWFGGLLALTMAVAFLAEVFVLPATIKLAPRLFAPRGTEAKEATLPCLRVLMMLGLTAVPAFAQPRFDGYATLMLDHLPNVEPSVTELRARIFGELTARASDILALTLSGYADGLAADRGGAVYDAILKPHELLAELTFARADLRVGLGRVVWGRLDELPPGDVVNPLDVSRFFFEGRSEARLPVGLVRARWFVTEDATLEGVYVPLFRRGRFDQLDEPTSPFNLRSGIVTCLEGAPPIGVRLRSSAAGIGVCPEPAIESLEPGKTFENAQGGVRFTGTVQRVDYAIAAYRGFRTFGTIAPEALGAPVAPVAPVALVERFPRFTMVSGDFESVRGPWAFRGEAAVFDEDDDPRPGALGGAPGVSWDAGFAIDRTAGAYRLSGSVLMHHQPPAAPGFTRTTADLIFGADRSFARERYTTRTFGVVNVSDGSAFVRNVTTMTARDNVAVEGSIGWFVGESDDVIGRFADRDFLYARVKVYF